MGLEFIDAFARIEKEFGVVISPKDDLNAVFKRDLMAIELHDVVCKKCRAGGLDVPDDSWIRMQRILADVCGVPESQIQRKTFLLSDLDMS